MRRLVLVSAWAGVALLSGGARGAAAPAPNAVVAAGGAATATATATASANATAVDDPLTVEVLTFGPGGHPFTSFGHNAIRIVDRRVGSDVVYNFGTFSFDSPWLILEFLQGRLRYWLSRSTMAGTAQVYQRENRDIETQRLDLSPAQKRELVLRLEANARPENRDYRYDYFADNCSTRVRDALDAVLQGRLRASAVRPGSMTLRAHALRMVAEDLPLYTALLIVLGPRADRPVDEWAETFLPEMLQRTLRGAQSWSGGPEAVGDSPSGQAPAGAHPPAPAAEIPVVTGHLVKVEHVIFADTRPPIRREPPNRLPGFLGVGVAMGLIMFFLGRLGSRFAAGRVLFGLVISGAGLILGGVGCFLAGAWALTPHAVVYRNENVLLFAPFAIVFIALGGGVALGRPGAIRAAFLVAAAALGLAVAACGLKLFPWSRQENGALILLMLPVWWGLTAGVRAVGGAHVRSTRRM